MAKKSSTAPATQRMFKDPSGQEHMFEKSLQEELEQEANRPVECLGQKFANDAERRKHFLALLAKKLSDPTFRKTDGFPQGRDEDILALSDPPYYTACPNPWATELAARPGCGGPSSAKYHRDPFAVDVSEGKTDSLYKAHSYHTKVPHLAIVPSILHYTEPGDLVLDGFCGSGMTGVAAQFCGSVPIEYREQLEREWKSAGLPAPKWGARRAILNDLGPAATFIAAGYNLPFETDAFERAASSILAELQEQIGWMYETSHKEGKAKGRINYTVWSEVFACNNCSNDVVFVEQALDPKTKRIREQIKCPSCGAVVSKEQMQLTMESYRDPATRQIGQRPKRVPVLINYSVGKAKFEKKPDSSDIELLEKISRSPIPPGFPLNDLPDCQMTRVGRMATTKTTAIHHMFLARPLQALGRLWQMASEYPNAHLKRALLFMVEQAIRTMSVLNSYEPLAFSQNARGPKTFFYVPSQLSEVSPWFFLEGKAKRLVGAFSAFRARLGDVAISTGDCGALPLPNGCVDYIFTDPPFGENIYYADLNYLNESWHRVWTSPVREAVLDRVRGKGIPEYQELMHRCFSEYHRVLKPGRWMTVVFSNSKNSIWHAIQEALGRAGFVVADVRTLDKQQGSFKQVTSTAVKQDLVISAYKPTDALEARFRLQESSPEDAWAFVREHLTNVPVFVQTKEAASVIADRTPQMLLDRMTAFHVQRGVAVPLSSAEFISGLAEQFSERDGMYFLPDQVAMYDRKRASVSELQQLELFVTDESSAIQWLQQVLSEKPQKIQDLRPLFMREIQAWADHETMLELHTLLEQGFLCYDGDGPVPNQIHAYLSSNFKELRNRPKTDAELREKAKDRWYVPDPNKMADLEKLRDKDLLKEFQEYCQSKQKKLKLFRTEAVRAGFKAAYDQQDYKTIIVVAAKLPETVLQEDEKLLMYFDVATMRMGDEDKDKLFQ